MRYSLHFNAARARSLKKIRWSVVKDGSSSAIPDRSSPKDWEREGAISESPATVFMPKMRNHRGVPTPVGGT